jgi:succinoglycan biosynthesis protein ExoA
VSDEPITIIVPARNEEGFIGGCLDSILSQDMSTLQVIVVVGASSDRTADIVAEYAQRDQRIEVLHNPVGSIPRSLNLALQAASGRFLVRVDAHSTIPHDYVSKAVEHLLSGRWGGVGGRKDAVGRTTAGRAIAVALGSPFGVGGSVYHHGTTTREVDHIPFGAYPTELVRRLGGWNERVLANEDYEFDYRLRQLGYRLLFDPTLRIEWLCRQSISDLFRQYRRYGRGKASVVRLHPSSVRIRHTLPPALVLALLGAALLAPKRPIALGAVLVPYAGVLLAGTATGARNVESAALPYLPAALTVMHVAYGLGFWEGMWNLVVESLSPKSQP